MTIRIRKSDEHFDEIASLDMMCFTTDEATPVELTDHSECWVALDGDEVVGYLVAYAANAELAPVAGCVHYVDRYGVASTHAGKGIGKRLLRAWLRWAHEWPGFAWTYTVARNAQSINALFGAGFRAWDPDVLPSGETHDRRYCVWRKEL